MTFATEFDRRASRPGESLPLAFESSAAELSGIRVLPAQFAKLMGVSKQAVTEWKKSGRVTIGIDGRIDPRQAVAQLLRTGDPRRLRSKILAPLMQEVHKREQRIRELAEALADAQENAEFQGGSTDDLLAIFDCLKLQVEASWEHLRELPAGVGRAAILTWLDFVLQRGTASGSTILDFAQPERSEGEEGGGRRSAGSINNLHE